ncbi:hypothetical protein FHX37_0481 [Haloactinospora alba]|uniref:Uncharacterized protein n=1 Tax=Haloactinospora alba TaxID=405555 RepID=A0A543NFI4_9ACTN|nr:DUF6221 family protein [Haloactinospora alba]TQN30599.1 hypothetical protein FHX37_0481 [Haloactinospora alba]
MTIVEFLRARLHEDEEAARDAVTIVEFLAERLDEDERAARAAIDPERPGTHWQWIEPSDDTPAEPEDGYLRGASLRTVERFPTYLTENYPELYQDRDGRLPAFVIDTADELRSGAAGHIARNGPARVLAEVEAKRRIVAQHAPVPVNFGDEYTCTTCAHSPTSKDPQPCGTLKLLAAVYADHPDYRKEWAP